MYDGHFVQLHVGPLIFKCMTGILPIYHQYVLSAWGGPAGRVPHGPNSLCIRLSLLWYGEHYCLETMA